MYDLVVAISRFTGWSRAEVRGLGWTEANAIMHRMNEAAR